MPDVPVYSTFHRGREGAFLALVVSFPPRLNSLKVLTIVC